VHDASIDLRGWIRADHAELRAKLFRSVVHLVPTDQWARPVDGGGSTVNHLLLHLARHQDLAVSTAIRNHPPLFAEHAPRLGLAGAPAWAGLPERDDPAVSAGLPADALLDYVNATFLATERWLQRTGSMVLDTVPGTSARLRSKAGLTDPGLDWLHSMWHGKPLWWLLQWPVIGHGHAHVGELISLRNRLGLSPF
jgi:hypothetical protein